MTKTLFFSVPLFNVSKTLMPLVDQLSRDKCDVVYYNTPDFKPDSNCHFKFIAYPDCFQGYYADQIFPSISYIQFGEIFLDAAISLMDFLLLEIEREKPDFIIHSNLAVWGCLLAKHFKLPAVTLFSTAVLDKRIVLPYFRRIGTEREGSFDNINDAIGFFRKSMLLYKRLELNERPDPWDAYLNKGQLNIVCILKSLQPQSDLLGGDFKFIGFPALLQKEVVKKKTIYVSMGTVLSGDVAFFRLCINVLRGLELDAIISVGTKVDIDELPALPDNIRVVPFVDQVAILTESMLFVSRGGMASVHESIYTLTPMIVIPLIPEQQITAERIQELGIGIHIPANQISELQLQTAIQQILVNSNGYTERLKMLLEEVPPLPPHLAASDLIGEFIERDGSRRISVRPK